MKTPTLTFTAAARFAIPASAAWIRPLVPEGVIGAYLLLDGDHPLYVGRSDSCLRTRLIGHELLPKATHLVWQSCVSARQAFHLESFWYDRLKADGRLLNRVHPAKPHASNEPCPYCELAEAAAPMLFECDPPQLHAA